jgi:hypothetical protein
MNNIDWQLIVLASIPALSAILVLLAISWKYFRILAQSNVMDKDAQNSMNALRGTTNVLSEVAALIIISEMVLVLALSRIISGEITAVFYTGLTAYFVSATRARARDFSQPKD